MPVLKSVYEESLVNGKLPPTLSQATISGILKKDKDPSQCSSYRPISLLCCDYKILTKVLAQRLEAFIPIIIDTVKTKQVSSLGDIRFLMYGGYLIYYCPLNPQYGLKLS